MQKRLELKTPGSKFGKYCVYASFLFIYLFLKQLLNELAGKYSFIESTGNDFRPERGVKTRNRKNHNLPQFREARAKGKIYDTHSDKNGRVNNL